MRTWMIVVIAAGALLITGLLADRLFPISIAPATQATLTPRAETAPVGASPTPGRPAPLFTTPVPLQEPLPEQQLRGELIDLQQHLCQDLQLIAGLILNTGILNEVPPRIQEITGLTIDELESMETAACKKEGGRSALEAETTAQLLNDVSTIEWLDRVHLAAIDDVTMKNPVTRPINASGSFAAFLELHDTIVREMRNNLSALSEDPTLENARQMGSFWEMVLVPHARAEEEELFPLARSVGDPGLSRSADLVESEHRPLDAAVANYMQTLQAVEQGQAQVTDLAPIARDLRGKTELHFGKEEQSVIRPLQERVTDEQFRPVVVAQERAVGQWAHQQGWKGLPNSP